MKFKICKFGVWEACAGLDDLALDHPQLLALSPLAGNKRPCDLKPGESCQCRGQKIMSAAWDKRAVEDVFTVVRTT